MKSLSLTLLLLFSSYLLGCSANPTSTEHKFHVFESKNYSGIENELSRAKFDCASKEDCPQNVGLLFSKIETQGLTTLIGQCTAFLIANDIVATNSHCILNKFKEDRSSCPSEMAVRFIGKANEKKIYGCKEVISFSDVENLGFDYAFVRIKPSDIEPLKINKNGLKDNQPIKIAKITPFDGTVGGTLETEKCKVGMNTFINTVSLSPWSKSSAGLGCTSVQGHSGSPVLNEQVEVIGILQSAYSKEVLHEYLSKAYKKFQIVLPEKLIPHFIFTNLSCVKDPTNQLETEDKCKEAESFKFLKSLNAFDKTGFYNSEAFENWKKSLPSIFIYTFILQEDTFFAQAYPRCIKPQKAVPNYQDYVQFEQTSNDVKNEYLDVTFQFQANFNPIFELDNEYHLKPIKQVYKIESASLNLKLQTLHNYWDGNAIRESILNHVETTQHMVSLQNCSDQDLNSGNEFKILLSNGEIVLDNIPPAQTEEQE